MEHYKGSGQAPPPKTPSIERWALAAIVALSLLLSVGYALASPWGEAPDETAHERYVEYLVRYARLPPITGQHPYTNESQQPPLYYSLGALLVWATRLVRGGEPLNNPLQANAAPAPPSVVYAVLAHRPGEQFPFYGYLLRGLSISIGLVSVALVYAAARALVPPPAPPLAALLATLLAALQPQRLFIGASVSNENLALAFSALLCLLICRSLVARPAVADPSSHRNALLVGVAFGLGLLSKFTVGSFALPLAWTFWVGRAGKPRSAVTNISLLFGAALLVAGPFLLYNTLAYGDPIAGRAVAAMLPGDSNFRLTDLFWLHDPFRWYFWSSYWGVFGWQRIWMPGWFYGIFALLVGAAILGGVRLLLAGVLDRAQRQACAALLAQALIAYAGIVLYSLRIIAWQGREIFTALPGLCILMGLGIAGLASGRYALGRAGESSPARLDRARIAASVAAVALVVALTAANLAALQRLHEIFDPLVR
jgi:hypothetical protein